MTQPKWKLDTEYVTLIEDLLDREEVQKLQGYTQHHFTTRLEHSISVSHTSYRIAKRLGLDAKAVARAGLLHDLFYHDWRVTKFEEGSHAYVHPRIACENAKKLTELSDLECDIIIKHMWMATVALPRYKESYVVTFVDKYCAVKEVTGPLSKQLHSHVKKQVKSAWSRMKFAGTFQEEL